jgi:hypothetical protein
MLQCLKRVPDVQAFSSVLCTLLFFAHCLCASATSAFFHTCDQRYDCARGDYTEAIPEIISAPLINTTTFSSLAVSLQVRIPAAIELFDIDERMRVREAVSRQFRVPVDIVSISNVFGTEEFVQMSVSIGLASPTLCIPVLCEYVQISTQNTVILDLPGSAIVQQPTCNLCQAEQELVFASAGTLDDPYSCKKECAAGFFQFQGLKSAPCEQHSKPVCSTQQFLLAGTAISDAVCVNCSDCEGAQLLTACSEHRDTECKACPEPAARQYWTGNQCSPACETGFVWDVRKQECEFCEQTLCEAGYQAPLQRDNCTHCVSCAVHPVHAHWSTQNDRFDCMWLCDEGYELLDMACVTTNYSAVQTLSQLQPICHPGQTFVNFECKSCFEAAMQGLIPKQDLPQPADIDDKWQWLYGCKWQCIHAAGYWELRPENSLFWECISVKMHTVMLRGNDMSWATQELDNISVNPALRRQATSETRTLFSVIVILVAVPVFVLVCMVIVGVARRQWSVDVSEERQPLLNV